MDNDGKMQLLEELTAVQKMLEEKIESQGQMIRKYGMLMANDGLVSQIIDFFPYPMAIFTRQFTVVLVNQAFETETKTGFNNLDKGAVRLLKNGNTQLAASVIRVFAGETSLLENLKNPFSLFSGITPPSELQSDHFHKAVIFPVPTDDSIITHGVIVFMP
ncbi:MAG: hypothetical protein GX119_03930 [Syntrophomonadaceae bacterium]|jgi:hypothetical protein|nr:hypothetical protein [Syntrophomonadaceae bacterium]